MVVYKKYRSINILLIFLYIKNKPYLVENSCTASDYSYYNLVIQEYLYENSYAG